ncbi:Serine/threonine protein kinase [Glycomyces sambucus]|uniref:Serine/threonine protein kinase n=1 Tax=Glycomyces sambucus TaxID=380244 RepID=A0A1G9KHW9_9ACTN|nr:serine/threonine-protein kinase [Glycomyces sambucus]SDL48973.1 Serine/threonine protein kinase [Glycomyces sambucus]
MQSLAPGDPERIGPYRTIAELGRGAMGRVFLASAPDGRPVAVKLIAAALIEDEEFRARFRREVAASKQVAGAYTAAVIDAGPDDQVPWLASEFLVGPNLKDVVESAGPLPEATVLRLAAGLASALAAIHSAGMVHRDLKPANVILAADGPRVIDFGIARAADGITDTNLTKTGGVIGTPGFMSPEQAESGTVSAASDVFSLGSVLVLAATGHSPFAGASTLETLNNVVRSQPDLGALSPRLRAIVERCLVRLPGARPTPAELTSLIGPVAPSTRPWPDSVNALAERQRRQLSSLLGDAGVSTTLVDEAAAAAPPVPPSAPASAFDQYSVPSAEPAAPASAYPMSAVPASAPPTSPVTSPPLYTQQAPYQPPAAPPLSPAPGFAPGQVSPGQYPAAPSPAALPPTAQFPAQPGMQYTAPPAPPQYPGQPVYAAPPPYGPRQPSSNAAAVGITVIAAVLVIALVGGLVWFLNKDGDDPDDDPTRAVSSNDPSEDATTPDQEPETTGAEEETTAAAEGSWSEVYADHTVSLTTTFDSASTCQYQEVDFDDITTTGSIYYGYNTTDEPYSYTDLVLNPCDIDYSTNTGLTNVLYTPSSSSGTFFDAAVTPDECWAELEGSYPALNWTVDPWDPGAAPLTTGMMLCLYTESAQLVLAEVTTVTAETSSNWMTVEFTTALYAAA